MKILHHYLLATLLLIAATQPPASGKSLRSARQPFPDRGFWVLETTPGQKFSTIRFYANSNHLVSEKLVDEVLDVRKLPVRRQLNEMLRKELEKDTTAISAPVLYEIR